MKNYSKYICLFICLFFNILFSQNNIEKPKLIIHDFYFNGIAELTRDIIVNRLRSEIIGTRVFHVMENAEISALLKEKGLQQSETCDDKECFVEIGRVLNLDRIIIGTIGQINDFYTMSLRMIDIKSGEILYTVNEDCDSSISIFISNSIKNIVDKLLSKDSLFKDTIATPLSVTNVSKDTVLSDTTITITNAPKDTMLPELEDTKEDVKDWIPFYAYGYLYNLVRIPEKIELSMRVLLDLESTPFKDSLITENNNDFWSGLGSALTFSPISWLELPVIFWYYSENDINYYYYYWYWETNDEIKKTFVDRKTKYGYLYLGAKAKFFKESFFILGSLYFEDHFIFSKRYEFKFINIIEDDYKEYVKSKHIDSLKTTYNLGYQASLKFGVFLCRTTPYFGSRVRQIYYSSENDSYFEASNETYIGINFKYFENKILLNGEYKFYHVNSYSYNYHNFNINVNFRILNNMLILEESWTTIYCKRKTTNLSFVDYKIETIVETRLFDEKIKLSLGFKTYFDQFIGSDGKERRVIPEVYFLIRTYFTILKR